MTAAEMLRRLQAISIEGTVGPIIDQNLERLTLLNLKQLKQGKNNRGELLSPKHSENPFFKTPQAAANYAAWKHRLNPDAPYDVPDLKITGVYWDSISFERRGNTVTADASAPFAGKIAQTFNGTPLGLDDDSHQEAYYNIIRSPMLHSLADQIGCSVIYG